MTGREDNQKGQEGESLADYFGQKLSDGDRYGEVIPSIFAWMPPDALRERVEYLEEISENLRQKKKGG